MTAFFGSDHLEKSLLFSGFFQDFSLLDFYGLCNIELKSHRGQPRLYIDTPEEPRRSGGRLN